MNEKSLLILKAAKALITLRIKRAGDWTFYANPSTCLYGPHSGVSFWGECDSLEKVCKQFNIPFVRYAEKSDSGLVLAKAKQLAARYERFCAHVNQWTEIDHINYGDNSVESIQQNRAGKIREVMVLAPGGDVCF